MLSIIRHGRSNACGFPLRRAPISPTSHSSVHIRSVLQDVRHRKQSSSSNSQKDQVPSSPSPASTAPTPTKSTRNAASATLDKILPPRDHWLNTSVLRPLGTPFRAYDRGTHKYPRIVQILTMMTVYLLGDLSSQYISQPSDDPKSSLWKHWDGLRTLRNIVIGAGWALPSYYWFMFISTTPRLLVKGSPAASLALRVGVVQIFFTPVIQCYFFGMQAMLSGTEGVRGVGEEVMHRLRIAGVRIKDTLPPTWYNSFKVWPAVMVISFTYVPLRYRSAFGGVVAVFWQTYLSMVNKKAEDGEAGDVATT